MKTKLVFSLWTAVAALSAGSALALENIPLNPGESIIIGSQRISCQGSPGAGAPETDPFTVTAYNVDCMRFARFLTQLRAPFTPGPVIVAKCRKEYDMWENHVDGTITGMLRGQTMTFSGDVEMTAAEAGPFVSDVSGYLDSTAFVMTARATPASPDKKIHHIELTVTKR